MVTGDYSGLPIPARASELEALGAEGLTGLLQQFGALDPGNAVTDVSTLEPVSAGSTGRKFLLTLSYARPRPGLHQQLFVKFSRDYDDPRRDAARFQMQAEVLLARLSREADFPIRVPVAYFADFHAESGSGVMISERVDFGNGHNEPHYAKALDYRMPEPLAHYRALIRALARLAGHSQAAPLSTKVADAFPFNPEKLQVGSRHPATEQDIQGRVAGYGRFAEACPRLIPARLRSQEFLHRLMVEAPRLNRLQSAVYRRLGAKPEMIALCHWNAHVDNAWFWRAPAGAMECGLMDWGNVSQMNLGMALWGCLSGAEPWIWNQHLDSLLQLFCREFQASGGHSLDADELHQHLLMYAAIMGLTWLLDGPVATLSRVVGGDASCSRYDPRIQDNEKARAQLLIMLGFLNLWQRSDMTGLIRSLENQ